MTHLNSAESDQTSEDKTKLRCKKLREIFQTVLVEENVCALSMVMVYLIPYSQSNSQYTQTLPGVKVRKSEGATHPFLPQIHLHLLTFPNYGTLQVDIKYLPFS